MKRYILIYKYFNLKGILIDTYQIFYDFNDVKRFIKLVLRKYPNARILIFTSTEMEMINYEY